MIAELAFVSNPTPTGHPDESPCKRSMVVRCTSFWLSRNETDMQNQWIKKNDEQDSKETQISKSTNQVLRHVFCRQIVRESDAVDQISPTPISITKKLAEIEVGPGQGRTCKYMHTYIYVGIHNTTKIWRENRTEMNDKPHMCHVYVYTRSNDFCLVPMALLQGVPMPTMHSCPMVTS